MKKIRFSKHALIKLEVLRNHGVNVTKEILKNAVINPERIDTEYKQRLIAQCSLDESHVLRVVFEDKGMR